MANKKFIVKSNLEIGQNLILNGNLPNTPGGILILDSNGKMPAIDGSNLTGLSTVVGEQAYTTAGTYSWVCPVGVTKVSVVCVGGGATGGGYSSPIANGQASSFTATDTFSARGGFTGSVNVDGTAALPNNVDGGGRGGYGYVSGGGGAGGYSGNGGDGKSASGWATVPTGITAGNATGGGAGGGFYNESTITTGGGGVGLFGQGASGTTSSNISTGGTGGSGGANGTAGYTSGSTYIGGNGGLYGGGGGGGGGTNYSAGAGSLIYKNNITVTPGTSYTVVVGAGGTPHANAGSGARGAVRIIWGTGRTFPSNAA